MCALQRAAQLACLAGCTPDTSHSCPIHTLSRPQDALARRDAEIQRLSAQLEQGPDVDALAQRYRNDANEAVILQLNQQVLKPVPC